MKVQTNIEQLKPQPIKWLSNTRKRELEEQNIARISCGLSPIKPKLRRCLACSGIFESIERRLCGCTDRQEAHVMGYDGY
ncbi:MAG: hypothetical protein ACOH5I_01185 [Oligoflexus sp.]